MKNSSCSRYLFVYMHLKPFVPFDRMLRDSAQIVILVLTAASKKAILFGTINETKLLLPLSRRDSESHFVFCIHKSGSVRNEVPCGKIALRKEASSLLTFGRLCLTFQSMKPKTGFFSRRFLQLPYIYCRQMRQIKSNQKTVSSLRVLVSPSTNQ